MGRKKLVNKKKIIKEEVGVLNSEVSATPSFNVFLPLEKDSKVYKFIKNQFENWIMVSDEENDIDIDNIVIDMSGWILFKKQSDNGYFYKIKFNQIADDTNNSINISIESETLDRIELTEEIEKYFNEEETIEFVNDFEEEPQEENSWDTDLDNVSEDILGIGEEDEKENYEEENVENINEEENQIEDEEVFDLETHEEENNVEEEIENNIEKEQPEEEEEEEIIKVENIKLTNEIEQKILEVTKKFIKKAISGQLTKEEQKNILENATSSVGFTKNKIIENKEINKLFLNVLEQVYNNKEK